MNRKIYILLLLVGVTAVLAYQIPFLPFTPYNYANIPLPIDVINNLSQMDNTPSDNPVTDHGATLGRVLFYDVELSANRTVSCATCHRQEFSFTDTARFSRGFNGQFTSRNSMGLIHARFQRDSTFFWDNRAASLEQQVLMPVVSAVEMGLSLDTLVARVSSKGYYGTLFQNAFGDATVTTERISKAIAQFIRSMNTFGSKYRQGVDLTKGSPETTPFANFTAQENLGKDLFMDITRGNCQACHTRNVMVQQGAQNIGLDLIYTDNGVGAATGRRTQNGKFSVPSLINVALTAPYMHDGRFKTLEQVIDFYSDSIKEHANLSGFLREIIPGTLDPNNNTCDTCPPRRPHYSPTEKAALVAFLKTLTDTVITKDVRWSNPFRECSTHNTFTVASCGAYVWFGVSYANSGTYTRSYLNANGCPSVDTLRLTVKNKPLPPATISISLVSDKCGNRIYRYTAPALALSTSTTVAATGYNWTMPTGPVGVTGVLDSGTLSSRVIRIRYSSNEAATSLDSIRVAFTSTCGNSPYKAVKLNNTKRAGCTIKASMAFSVPEGETDMPNAIRVFSNPTAGAFSVMIHSVQSERVGYAVYDDQGRRITAGLVLPNTLFSVGSQFRAGLYFLVADMKGEKITVKLVKQ
jgi:cytochrome c peroxidase